VRSGGTSKPAVGFAEVPDFHVAVARLDAPLLEDRPILVGGDPEKRGKVLGASPDLRIRGVRAGTLMSDALVEVPEAVWVRTDMARAREVSGLLRAAMWQEVEAIETEGLAGFYWAAPAEPRAAELLAGRIGERVRNTTGLVIRIGVAPVRFVARWVAEDLGREGARVLCDDELESYLALQPIDRLPGVGPKTAARLVELGAKDLPGIRVLGLERLEVLLGNHGRNLWRLACGDDPKPLRAKRHPESLSRVETFDEPEADPQYLESSLSRLATALETALRRDGLRAGRIALRLTRTDETSVTRSRSLAAPVSSAGELLEAARELLARVEVDGRIVRRAALVLAGLELSGAEDRQLDLF